MKRKNNCSSDKSDVSGFGCYDRTGGFVGGAGTDLNQLKIKN